jgi:hypothetical protein
LKQGENKSISSYIDREKMISKWDNGSLGNLLAMNFFQGMCDDFHQDWVEYSMGLDKDQVTFNTALQFVKVSYKRLGKEHLFDEGTMTAQAMTNPPYLIPSQHRISIPAAIQPAPRENSEANTENILASMLVILERMEAEKKVDFRKLTHYLPGGTSPAQQVQWWVYGDFGHFADHYPNKPLLVARQTVLRKTILVEKWRFRQNSIGRKVVTQTPVTILESKQVQ